MVRRRLERAQELGNRATRGGLAHLRTRPRSKTGPLGLSKSSPVMIKGPEASPSKLPGTQPLPDRTTVALFGTEVEVPITYCSQGEVWSFPSGTSREKTGEARAQQVLLQETSVQLEVDSFMALPSLVDGQELVVGVVKPPDVSRMPRGSGATLKNLGWVTLGRAFGAFTTQFVLILNET